MALLALGARAERADVRARRHDALQRRRAAAARARRDAPRRRGRRAPVLHDLTPSDDARRLLHAQACSLAASEASVRTASWRSGSGRVYGRRRKCSKAPSAENDGPGTTPDALAGRRGSRGASRAVAGAGPRRSGRRAAGAPSTPARARPARRAARRGAAAGAPGARRAPPPSARAAPRRRAARAPGSRGRGRRASRRARARAAASRGSSRGAARPRPTCSSTRA